MTETTDTPAENAPAKKRAGGLNGMLLPELKQMAGGLGIKGAGGMRKSQLIEAIKAAQSGGGQSGGAHEITLQLLLRCPEKSRTIKDLECPHY